MIKEQRLNEIVFLRPVLVILLVMYHSFCPWAGIWTPFEGFTPNEAYKWIAEISYSFMLPLFVFTSGYVWAFQREVKNKKETIGTLMVKKSKRLILPSIIFSVLYLLMFNRPGSLGIKEQLDSAMYILNGAGHLWFLPMLFWCFILMWILKEIHWGGQILIAILLLILPIPSLPLRISEVTYYFIYFVIGYNTMALYDKKLNSKEIKQSQVYLLWSLFICSFVPFVMFKETIYGYSNISTITAIVVSGGCKLWILLYSCLGLYAMYESALWFTRKYKTPIWMESLGSLCMGIYIFQQFVLKLLYYHTDIPQTLCPQLLPWLGFFVAFVVSFVLTYILKKYKFGRQLL